MMISLGRFSIFSKFWFFGLFVGQKMTKWPKMKRFCLSHFILREPYILWFSFMVGMCKMIISSGVFFIFLKFWFSGLLGGKRVKNCQKWQKILLLNSMSQETYIIWLWFVVHKCKVMISPCFFFHFFKILIFDGLSWGKG